MNEEFFAAENGASAGDVGSYPSPGDTLLTRTDGRSGSEKTTAGPGSSETSYQYVPDSPDGYELAFAEGIEVDQQLLGTFQQTAHELGLTNDQAQRLGGMYADHVQALSEKMEAEQMAALQQAKENWEAEIKRSPGFQGNLANAKRALASYGSPQLFDLLDQTLLGAHPAMFDFVSRVGKALGEPKVQGRGSSVTETDPARILYPNHR